MIAVLGLDWKSLIVGILLGLWVIPMVLSAVGGRRKVATA